MFNLLIFLTSLILSACRTTTKPVTPPAPLEPPPAFSGQMQSMGENVRDLVPYLYDRDAFRAQAHRVRIDQSLERFAKASHQVETETGQAVLGDPLLAQRTLERLRGDLTRSLESFREGQFEFARTVAKASLSNCFQCHSVTPPGHPAHWDLEKIKDLKLQPLERFDLLVATRKYDQALALGEQALNDQSYLRDHAFDFEALLRRYLALVIRVEVDPRRAGPALDRILEKNELPKYDADQLAAWRTSIKVWAKEPVKVVRNAKDLFAQVKARFDQAAKLQHFEKDHAGDVEYLRASAILHNNLKLLRSPTEVARALYLLGRAYEVLDDLGAWSLHENYFEACVTKDPRGPLAKVCFDRLEQSLVMGFSGSAGVNLPPEERERLRRLKELL